MAMNDAPITIVGCGPGAADYVTPAASTAATEADVLVGSRRLLELFPQAGRTRMPYHAEEAILAEVAACLQAGRRVTVLVSGDSGLYSGARSFIERFGRDRCRVIPGISSVQVAFARVGIDWAGATILSAHGRLPAATSSELAACDKIAILGGTGESLQWAAGVAGDLQATHAAFVCERLTLDGERVREIAPRDLPTCGADPLCIILLLRRTLIK